jgi:hypothetical protein
VLVRARVAPNKWLESLMSMQLVLFLYLGLSKNDWKGVVVTESCIPTDCSAALLNLYSFAMKYSHCVVRPTSQMKTLMAIVYPNIALKPPAV